MPVNTDEGEARGGGDQEAGTRRSGEPEAGRLFGVQSTKCGN